MELRSDIKFPQIGQSGEETLKQMAEFRAEDADWRHGRTFGLVYFHSPEHQELIEKAYRLYFNENGLNPMAFKSLKRFEHETIRMCADLFHGDESTVGCLTTGGTESLMLAVKTYRDRARKTKPWILKPEIIVPESAHPALDKGADYFDVKLRHATVGADLKVDLDSVKRLINRNTIAIVGSAPQYPNGVIDPIVELGLLAEKHNLPLHVDACIGFNLPFIERAGYPLPAFDFRVKGVTSISSDLHKYGFAAKGASVLLWRSMDFMKYQFFVYENWTGGIYASASMPGTKAGGSIAAAWAALTTLGTDGYVAEAKRLMETARKYREGINSVAGLKVLGHPDAGLLSFHSTEKNVSIYAIADQLEAKGWSMDRNQRPESIHMTLSPPHSKVCDEFIADLKSAVEWVLAHPESATSGNAAMYGMMAKIPFRSMVKKSVVGIMEKMYSAKGVMPDAPKDGVENWGDLAEKIGVQALDVTRKISQALDRARGKE